VVSVTGNNNGNNQEATRRNIKDKEMEKKFVWMKALAVIFLAHGFVVPSFAEENEQAAASGQKEAEVAAPNDETTKATTPAASESSTAAKPAAVKPLTAKQIAARKRIKRIKKKRREEIAKAKSDPNYAKKLQILKRKAKIKHLQKLLREEMRRLQQEKIQLVGGKLRKPLVAKDTPKKVSSAEASIKFTADEEDTGDEISPLDVVDEARQELEASQDKLVEATDANATDDELEPLLKEESEASSLYQESLNLAKEYYTQIQEAAKENPSGAEGTDLSAIADVITELDQEIADEKATEGDDAE